MVEPVPDIRYPRRVRWLLFVAIWVALGVGLGFGLDQFIPNQPNPRCTVSYFGSTVTLEEFSDDGMLLRTGGSQGIHGAYQVWNTQTAKEITRFGRGNANNISLANGTRMLAVQDNPGVFRMVDLLTGKEWHYQNPNRRRFELRFLPGGLILLKDNMDNPLFEIETGRLLGNIRLPGVKGDINLSEINSTNDGRFLLTILEQDNVHLWSTRPCELKKKFEGLYPLLFSPDGGSVLAESDKKVLLLTVATGKTHVLRAAWDNFHWSGTWFSPDGKTLACLRFADENKAALWNVADGKRYGKDLPTAHLLNFRFPFSPDSRHIAYWTKEEPHEKLVVAETDSGKILWTVTTRWLGGNSWHFTPDSKFLLLQQNEECEVREVTTGNIVARNAWGEIFFTESGPLTVLSPKDGVKLIETISGREIIRLRVPGLQYYLGTIISKDARSMATVSGTEGNLHIDIWDLPGHLPIRWFIFLPFLGIGLLALLVKWKREKMPRKLPHVQAPTANPWANEGLDQC